MASPITVVYKSDSMDTIQSKLNRGGRIKFNNTVFRITKQLVIPKLTTVDLNGATLKRCASIQSIFINKVTPDTTEYNGDGGIVIMNGTVEGMGGYTFDNLITLFHAKNIVIQNVKFQDILCHGLELNGCQNVKVSGCKFLGYNMQSLDHAYRECIQIDHSAAGSFFLKGSSNSSKCYDGTPCNNIEILDCIFSKSAYRDYPFACIGNHTQIYKGKQHTDISIHDNVFYCKRNDIGQPCLSFISMKNVSVESNYFDCDKLARIYSKKESYLLNGSKVAFYDGDGACENIDILNNDITCSETAAVTISKKTKVKHKKIYMKNNRFDYELHLSES